MKKKLILLAGSLLAIAAVATTVVATNSNNDMSLLMQNVEALAADDENDITIRCSREPGQCWTWDPNKGECKRTEYPQNSCTQ